MGNLSKNELRIGNLIFQSGQITTIENISRSINDWERVNNKRLFDCTPIPLTEEWLLKFGLEKLDIDLYKIDNEYFILFFFNETYYIADEDWQNKKRIIGKGLIYVHQLQNLYFALTGEELTI